MNMGIYIHKTSVHTYIRTYARMVERDDSNSQAILALLLRHILCGLGAMDISILAGSELLIIVSLGNCFFNTWCSASGLPLC